MVARKSSIPHPSTLPPPPPPPPVIGQSQPYHDVQPINVQGSLAMRSREEDSPYKDMGNPWMDATSGTAATATVHAPDHQTLNPIMSQPTTTGASDVPDILKPGWSGANTPRSSIASDESRDFWESSDDEEQENKTKSKGKAVQKEPDTRSNSTDDLVIPPSLQIKRKPVASSPTQQSQTFAFPEPLQPTFASNNPFRKGHSTPQNPIDAQETGKSTSSSQLIDFSHDLPNEGSFPSYKPSHTQDGANVWEQASIPPQPQNPPPLAPELRISSPFSEQPPLIPVSPKADDISNPWSSQSALSRDRSPIPFAPSQRTQTYSSDNLLDRGSKADGRISLEAELRALPNAAQPSTSQPSLLDDDFPQSGPFELQQGHASDPSTSLPPSKPPRPATVVKPLTDADLIQLQEQRNETYQIKHFHWFDHRSGRLRMSSMLTQNKNGPCPLLALVNALILGADDESQAMLDNALKTREQVTLGLIVDNLMEELLSSRVHLDGDLPDVEELNRFLIKLRTGMNMNPRFIQPKTTAPNLMDARNSMLHMPSNTPQDLPGTFEMTPDIRLYSAFGIETVHGWLPEPRSEAVEAFTRSAQNYEDAQVIQFGEEELDYKLTTGGLSPQEQQLWADIISIKTFFQQHPTQLTPYGLGTIKQSLLPGAFAILFRNDHFSTIYKHPSDGKLYTLITDAGYADRDEVIWESLVDISGQQAEFFSGDFQSVSHHLSASERRRSSHLSTGSPIPEPLSPQQQQEQHDADFAMALHLQEEEEERMRQERNNRQESGSAPSSAIRGAAASSATSSGRRGQGIPIQLRGSSASVENRPSIPPRNQRTTMQTVSRPSDALDADAPPTYEEAARGKPYNPPLGSPLHPQSSATAEPVTYASSSSAVPPETVAVESAELPAVQRPQRRQSAYTENYERLGHPGTPRSASGRFEAGMSPAYYDGNTRMPGGYIHTGRGGLINRSRAVSNIGTTTNTGTRRRDDNDCTIM